MAVLCIEVDQVCENETVAHLVHLAFDEVHPVIVTHGVPCTADAAARKQVLDFADRHHRH
jgi:hypothetical protein